MSREFDEDDDIYAEIDPDLLLDEVEDVDAQAPPPPSLSQMEEDCAWAAELIDRRLAEDPNYPTAALLAEMRHRVKPLSAYKITDAEMSGLRAIAKKEKMDRRLKELEDEQEEGT
jgi:hypothetical protein